jgi:hypothetical protein
VRTRSSLLAAVALAIGVAVPAVAHLSEASGASTPSPLPVHQIESIMQADGSVSDGILAVEENRTDLHVRGGAADVPFVDGFQIQHEFFFQSLSGGHAIMNGDMALKSSEIQPVIDAMVRNHIVFQAQHQHLYDLQPMVWFVHLRAVGDPLDIAHRLRDVVAATSTPLPQHAPANPTTPLPWHRLAAILGGTASVGDNGVVTVDVARRNDIVLGGVHIDPGLNVQANIQFEPLGGGRAVVIPDFSMTADEVQSVTATMRARGWEVGCLYNQEIGESPQLYFSHMFKVGDAVQLAHDVRAGLDHTNV